MASDAQILTSLREALAGIVAGRISSYTTPGGKAVTLHNIKDLEDLIERYQSKVSAASRGVYRPVAFGEVDL